MGQLKDGNVKLVKTLSKTRDFLTPEPDLEGSTILVTGGTGSFGARFCELVLSRFNLKKLIVFSRDEMKQFELSNRLNLIYDTEALRFFIGDVRDQDRLEMAMRDVDVVIHAAALKQVPAAEYNPIECINTNVLGAENVVKASIRSNVQKVIALSTDKAANPVNLYGASKLASDKIFVAANSLSGFEGTKFSVVRYGNVIGSRGSFIPLLQNLVAQGATKVPITDENMTRFWISLDQGVNFVLSCLVMMKGGEIFVPKIPSMRLKELVEALAPRLDVEVIGARPGEKLHEVMITEDDAANTVSYDDRYVILPAFDLWGRGPIDDPRANAVPSRFKYSSETNEESLTIELMKKLCSGNDGTP